MHSEEAEQENFVAVDGAIEDTEEECGSGATDSCEDDIPMTNIGD